MRRRFGRLSGLVLAIVMTLTGLAQAQSAVEIQGHRGARGLAPENTLTGFRRALAIGVDVLELDVVTSADGVLMVNHDLRLNPARTRDGEGKWISEALPMNSLSAAAIKTFDIGRIDPGSRYAGRFPDQTAADGARVPALEEVFKLIGQVPGVALNIETKLAPAHPALSLPPAAFADKLVRAVRKAGLSARVSIQSFDWRTLQRVQKVAPEIPTVYLSAAQPWLDTVEAGQAGASPWLAGFDADNHGGSLPRLIKAAGGAIWSPYHRDLTAAALAEARQLGLRVVVWTVNKEADMSRLIDIGVDGIITDYPDRLRQVLASMGRPLPAPVVVE